MFFTLNHFASSSVSVCLLFPPFFFFQTDRQTDKWILFCLALNLKKHFLAFTHCLCQSRECPSQPFMTFTEEIISPPICLPSSSQLLGFDFFLFFLRHKKRRFSEVEEVEGKAVVPLSLLWADKSSLVDEDFAIIVAFHTLSITKAEGATSKMDLRHRGRLTLW